MITYRVIRSARKTLQVEIRPDGEVLVRAPQHLADAEIRRFVESKAGWIAEHRAKVKARAEQAADVERLSMEDIRRLADEAAKDIPERVRRFAPVVGVQYGRITIRNQKSKWGSCSSQGNLNFNCLKEILDAGRRSTSGIQKRGAVVENAGYADHEKDDRVKRYNKGCRIAAALNF